MPHLREQELFGGKQCSTCRCCPCPEYKYNHVRVSIASLMWASYVQFHELKYLVHFCKLRVRSSMHGDETVGVQNVYKKRGILAVVCLVNSLYHTYSFFGNFMILQFPSMYQFSIHFFTSNFNFVFAILIL